MFEDEDRVLSDLLGVFSLYFLFRDSKRFSFFNLLFSSSSYLIFFIKLSIYVCGRIAFCG